MKLGDNLLIVTHHDADGIAAASAFLSVFEDADLIVLPQFYEEHTHELPFSEYDTVVITDFGMKYMDKLPPNVIVIDHHDGYKPQDNLYHPLRFGYNPDREASASSLSSYLLYREFNKPELIPIGLVGAMGDRQYDGRFHGLNALLVKEGVKKGKLTLYKDLVLEGIRYKPLYKLLYESTDPYLPDLTGNSDNVLKFLSMVGIDPNSTYKELSMDDKKRLVTRLILLLEQHSMDTKHLIGEVYEINDKIPPINDLKYLTTLVNICGRVGRYRTAVDLLISEDPPIERAERIRKRYLIRLYEILDILRPQTSGRVRYVLLDDIPEYYTSILAEIIRAPDKTGVVVVRNKDYAKISIRGELTSHIVHLISSLGGESGGHEYAGGGRIPSTMVDEFLEKLQSVV